MRGGAFRHGVKYRYVDVARKEKAHADPGEESVDTRLRREECRDRNAYDEYRVCGTYCYDERDIGICMKDFSRNMNSKEKDCSRADAGRQRPSRFVPDECAYMRTEKNAYTGLE